VEISIYPRLRNLVAQQERIAHCHAGQIGNLSSIGPVHNLKSSRKALSECKSGKRFLILHEKQPAWLDDLMIRRLLQRDYVGAILVCGSLNTLPSTFMISSAHPSPMANMM
jgi:hypothetical protein